MPTATTARQQDEGKEVGGRQEGVKVGSTWRWLEVWVPGFRNLNLSSLLNEPLCGIKSCLASWHSSTSLVVGDVGGGARGPEPAYAAAGIPCEQPG